MNIEDNKKMQHLVRDHEAKDRKAVKRRNAARTKALNAKKDKIEYLKDDKSNGQWKSTYHKEDDGNHGMGKNCGMCGKKHGRTDGANVCKSCSDNIPF